MILLWWPHKTHTVTAQKQQVYKRRIGDWKRFKMGLRNVLIASELYFTSSLHTEPHLWWLTLSLSRLIMPLFSITLFRHTFVMDVNTFSRTALGWALRVNSVWIWRMEAHGPAIHLQKERREKTASYPVSSSDLHASPANLDQDSVYIKCFTLNWFYYDVGPAMFSS